MQNRPQLEGNLFLLVRLRGIPPIDSSSTVRSVQNRIQFVQRDQRVKDLKEIKSSRRHSIPSIVVRFLAAQPASLEGNLLRRREIFSWGRCPECLRAPPLAP